MSKSQGSHDPNVDFKLIIANLPENVCRLPPEVSFKPVKDLMRRVVDYPDNLRLHVGMPVDNKWRSDMAMCPFRDKRDALDAYRKMDRYTWRFQGHETVLVASLYVLDKPSSAMRWLAGPRLNRANPSMPVFYPPDLVPAGTIHADPSIYPTGPTHGNSRPANQRHHRAPRSVPDHALDPVQTNLYSPSSDLKSPLLAFESFINTGVIPASHHSSGATVTDACPRFFGPAAPDLYNSPGCSTASVSSNSSTMTNLHLASHGSNYSTLTDDGTIGIPENPYPPHNVSTPNGCSRAYPHTSSNSFGQSETSEVSPEAERDYGIKVIIRRVPPGVTPEQLSEHLEKIMPRYVQHKKPKPGEDNKWSVVFSKFEDANRAVERLRACDFRGKKLTAVPATESVAQRQVESGRSASGTIYSSTTRGPPIIVGSVPN